MRASPSESLQSLPVVIVRQVKPALQASSLRCDPRMVKDEFTILLAEDDPNDAILLEKAIRANRIANPIRFVRDGREAIEYLEGTGKYKNRDEFPFPRVIISDLKMPRLSGLELLEWLRSHPKCSVLPMILMSGSGLPRDVEKAYRLGANSYFQKPSSFDELVVVVKSAYQYWSRAEVAHLPD